MGSISSRGQPSTRSKRSIRSRTGLQKSKFAQIPQNTGTSVTSSPPSNPSESISSNLPEFSKNQGSNLSGGSEKSFKRALSNNIKSSTERRDNCFIKMISDNFENYSLSNNSAVEDPDIILRPSTKKPAIAMNPDSCKNLLRNIE